MLLLNISHRYDPTTAAREKRGKPPRKNRYNFYCHWVLALLVREIYFWIVPHS